MTWLVTHMWIVLAAASLVAVILGWSVRGMTLSGRVRQARVERDVARVELRDSRDEAEKLYAQIKKLSNGETPAAAVAAIDPALPRRIESLTAELARKSAEIETLKAAALAAVPAAAGAAPLAAGQAEDTLVWRNRHLESRVVHLESELAKTPAPSAAAAPGVAAGPDVAKLEWELGYLRTRVEALSAELAAVPAAVVAGAPLAADAPAGAAPVEEEIARLRWRVRFLEGRLAYFEGDDGASADANGSGDKPLRAAEAILGRLEAEDERADVEDAQNVSRVRPVALEKPVDGTPDDLTLIGGIGPKIQDLLNGLGIFHFDQIAEWQPENVAWIDDHLNFTGRIVREGWIEQAAVLVGEAADA